MRLNFSVGDQLYATNVLCFDVYSLKADMFDLSIIKIHLFGTFLVCSENNINVVLYGNCAQEAFDSKTADIEPPIVVVVRFARIVRREGSSFVV